MPRHRDRRAASCVNRPHRCRCFAEWRRLFPPMVQHEASRLVPHDSAQQLTSVLLRHAGKFTARNDNCCCILSCPDVASQRDHLTRSRAPTTVSSSFSFQNTDSISILPSLPNLLPHSLLSRLSGHVPTTDSIPNSVRSPQNSVTFFSPPATSGFPVLFQRRAPLPHTNIMPINHPLQGRGPLAVLLEAGLFACLDVQLGCCFKDVIPLYHRS